MGFAAVLKSHARSAGLQVVNPNLLHLEKDFAARRDPRVDQILHNFVLCVHANGPAGKRMQVDAMSTAIKAEFDPAMNQAFAAHALADARFVQQIHGALFQHARANAILDMFASLGLYDDALNARKMQKLGQDESGGSGSDDRNLGTMAFAHPRSIYHEKTSERVPKNKTGQPTRICESWLQEHSVARALTAVDPLAAFAE